MPVRKYRSVEDMPDTGSVDPNDPNLGRIIADVWAFNAKLSRASPMPGVHKFRTIEELNEGKERWRRNNGG